MVACSSKDAFLDLCFWQVVLCPAVVQVDWKWSVCGVQGVCNPIALCKLCVCCTLWLSLV